ncbi:MAG: HesA/MoeB/ThiF family protein [Armatimonadetes bacterium]|nr:HesA/MoeB/ThiF family protein [Armatimonadota bacterium]
MWPELTEHELERYKRQIQMAGFGEESQRRLKGASALVTRLGGLGGPAALYLAMAGIGKLFIAHGGTCTPSNLNRMLLMRDDAVGRPRIPTLEIVTSTDYATEENVGEWVSQVDLVCTTTPDFGERLVLNRECVRQRKPLVHSGMNEWECQLTVIVPGQTPCLECLVPEPPEWWDPYGFGVIGPVCGMLGCLTALEAIKVLTGCAEPLAGTILSIDLEEMSMSKCRPNRRSDCGACGHL